MRKVEVLDRMKEGREEGGEAHWAYWYSAGTRVKMLGLFTSDIVLPLAQMCLTIWSNTVLCILSILLASSA